MPSNSNEHMFAQAIAVPSLKQREVLMYGEAGNKAILLRLAIIIETPVPVASFLSLNLLGMM